MKIPRFVPTAIVLAIAAGACGSDAEALTKSEYIEQADAICQSVDDEIAPMFDEFFSDLESQGIDLEAEMPTDTVFVGYARVWNEMVSAWDDSLQDLRALGKPEGDEKMLERLLDDLESALADSVVVVDAAADGSEADRLAMEDYDPFHDVNARARVYGLAVCGSDG
ncbi:MAG: hypothetical protein ACR2QE_12350 [Acidimicrobiales bacterium]